MRQRGLATASSPWRTAVTRTGAEGESNGAGRRERVGERRKDQTMLWLRAIGLRCSGRDELRRRTRGTRRRQRGGKEETAALIGDGDFATLTAPSRARHAGVRAGNAATARPNRARR